MVSSLVSWIFVFMNFFFRNPDPWSELSTSVYANSREYSEVCLLYTRSSRISPIIFTVTCFSSFNSLLRFPSFIRFRRLSIGTSDILACYLARIHSHPPLQSHTHSLLQISTMALRKDMQTAFILFQTRRGQKKISHTTPFIRAILIPDFPSSLISSSVINCVAWSFPYHAFISLGVPIKINGMIHLEIVPLSGHIGL